MTDLTELVDSFNQTADSLRECLTSFIAALSDGKALPEDAVSGFISGAAELRSEYDSLYQVAKSIVGDDELPEEGSGISQIVNAVTNSKTRLIMLRVDEAKIILNKFINVKSAISVYSDELKPFQKEAAELLEKISIDTVDELQPDIDAAKAFLTALEYENISHSIEGIDILSMVSQYYPQRVQWGLVGHQYYIDSSSKQSETDNSRAPAASDAKKRTKSGSKRDKNPVPEVKTNGSVSQPPSSDDVILPLSNKPKSGNPSAASFKKEIPRLAKVHRPVRTIFPMLTNLGVLTKEQMYLFSIYMNCCEKTQQDKDDIEKTLDVLSNKGYISCCEYEGETVYFLSSYSATCLKKETIISMNRFWQISFGEFNFCYDGGIPQSVLSNMLCHNSCLLEYVNAMKDTLSKEHNRAIRITIRWNGTMYQVGLFHKNTLYLCKLAPTLESANTLGSNDNVLFCGVDCSSIEPDMYKRVFVFENGKVRNLFEDEDEESENEDEDDNGNTISDADGQIKIEFDKIIDREVADKEIAETELLITEEKTAEEKIVEEETIKNDVLPEETGIAACDELFALLSKSDVPSDNEFIDAVLKILNKSVKTSKELKSVVAGAVLLAYSAALEHDRPKTALLSNQLSLATHLMLNENPYTDSNLTAAFESENDPSVITEDTEALMLSSYLFAMLTPDEPLYYGLKTHTEALFNDYELYFENFPTFKPLFNKLMSVRKASPGGFTPAVIALLGNEAESEKYISRIRSDARRCLVVTAPKTRMKTLPTLYSSCFGSGSELSECMEIIAENRTDDSSIDIVKLVLSEYCIDYQGSFKIDQSRLEERLNEEWDKANPKNRYKLQFDARAQALRQFRIRIDLMISWADHITSLKGKREDIDCLHSLKAEIIRIIGDIQGDSVWKENRGANVLDWTLTFMRGYLDGTFSEMDLYSDLILTGVISVDDTGTPLIDKALTGVRFYEPWRNALRHITARKKTVDEVKAEILGDNLDAMDDENGLKDNLHQLEMLGKLLDSSDEDYIVSQAQMKEAEDAAEERTTRFRETLELAYTYNHVNETEKETISDIMAQFKPKFYEIGDFACWRRFLDALEQQISEFTERHKSALRASLDARLEQESKSAILLEADRMLEKERNFAVAEEYITRYDAGETAPDDYADLVLHDNDYFADFLSAKNFDSLLQKCRQGRGRTLRSYAWEYVERRLPRDWTARLRDDSRNMINNWPSGMGSATPQQIENLFRSLGFDVIKATKVAGRREEMFQLSTRPTAKGMADYRHPIAAFGTQMKPTLNVILLHGNFDERQLVDRVTSLNLRGISIVLMIDQAFDAAGRRQVGEIFHTQTSGSNPFLLVDQVLFLYLAMHQETERLPALLKCTLPYTTYQPFVRDSGSTPDEMFCGRSRELATIIDPNGACVVYGGRQLGKTALLERAESRCSKPENREYAVYSSIMKIKSESEVVGTLIKDIDRKTNGKIALTECETLKDMCEQLDKLFRNGKIAAMHLLIDEVDDFLGAIADDSYAQIRPLVDLKRETQNRFKFVLTGLHNVCRAENATKENGIFGQLGTPLCVKPLSPADAMKLLSRPLGYLGFQMDGRQHLETILTNTNYYPGILQFFGYMLVETLTGQYAKYYRAAQGNPPFTLRDEQLGAVMNSADLNKSIKDKFRWTLELDARYFMIARCIAALYHYSEEDGRMGGWLGYSVEEIRDMAQLYDIHCLENESIDDFVNLLDEMVEMGILSQAKSGQYRLRRSSFIDIIGESLQAIEADIKNENNEVVQSA